MDSSADFRKAVVVHPLVKEALKKRQPIVALESTIVSHGMPFPENLRTAQDVEGIVRGEGAVPATVAILGGVPHIGLTNSQLEHLSRIGPRAHKTSRRDIAYVVSQGLDGATTVSGTMFFAHLAGIRVFVTGGIGGVHRGAQETMDVSADLTELGRTPVAVVCAGVKSILDIPRTLEFLETQGVTVAALGTDQFPAFFRRECGCKAPATCQTEEECARLLAASARLGVSSGTLIAVPIPKEAEAEGAAVEAAITEALKLAELEGLKGAQITPFLLRTVNELTGGASLAANIALVKNNARIGARISARLARLGNCSAPEAPLTRL